ncbi:MAG: 3-isopropylmalate dehydratase small subunit, partial [SAR202 cluster bacterium]|nr:3-isopropylmalate dehydratase small subunit [SAR202 cluster bacterium]
FGSGSSREHAPWALLDYGFRCIIAPSFADIFYNNCFQNGVLPVVLPEETVEEVMSAALAKPGYRVTADLESRTVLDSAGGVEASFEVEPFRRYCMLNGLDEIGMTLEHEDKIAAFEESRGPHGGVLASGR